MASGGGTCPAALCSLPQRSNPLLQQRVSVLRVSVVNACVYLWPSSAGKLHATQAIQVADEESRQWRAFNLIYSTLHGRGLAVAELCHPLWNDFKRSLGKARMMSTLLKATHTVNHGAGPWRSGKRRLGIHAAAKRLMDLAEYEPEYMANLTERVNWDRGWQGGGGPLTREEVLKSRAAKRRLPYASRPCSLLSCVGLVVTTHDCAQLVRPRTKAGLGYSIHSLPWTTIGASSRTCWRCATATTVCSRRQEHTRAETHRDAQRRTCPPPPPPTLRPCNHRETHT